MKKRILFLCAQHSIRSQMAESILIAKGGYDQWDVWSSPIHGNKSVFLLTMSSRKLASLSKTPQTTQPYFGLPWDEGVILCSGMADT